MVSPTLVFDVKDLHFLCQGDFKIRVLSLE